MTAFGKKTAPAPMSAAPTPGGRAAFGKKAAPAPQGRFTAASSTGNPDLSPKAMAFLEAERARNAASLGLQIPPPAGKTARAASPAQPSYAHASGVTGVSPGKPVWGRRIIALLIDSVIIGVPVTFFFGFGIFGAAATMQSEEATLMALLMFCAILGIASILYSVSMEASKKQATWGKMAVGAIVVDKTGGKPTLGAIILRNTVGRFCSNVLPFYIGYFIGIGRQDRRCVHDLIAGTMVCEKSKGGLSQADVFA
jgi:uncharacterized RDD family membrane protein YckC